KSEERDVVVRGVAEGAVGDRQVRCVRDGTHSCHLLLRHRLQDPPQAHGLPFLCSLSARGSSPSFTRGTQGDGPTSCSQEQQPMNNSQRKFKVFAGKRMTLFAG
ncbi:unnamed protein product, partial [Musa textilis]